jgi:glutaryl-CoA dehydrogenase
MSWAPVGTAEPDYDLAEPLDPDAAGVLGDLPAADRAHADRARGFVREVGDRMEGHWERAEYPLDLVTRMGELDLLRDGVDVAGRAPMTTTAAGLVTMEVSRGDGSLATVIAVQGGLAMRAIAQCGSAAQRERWLPAMASGELLGAFALTEPTHGSDSVALETRARSVAGGVRITGAKKWIGNGSAGGITVVWARGDDEAVHGYVVPQESEGYRATTITGKTALRAIHQAHIELDDVFVPDDHVLPGARAFADTARVLLATRLGVAWSAVGHATACYETAVHYATQRVQFGRAIGATQLVQERLASMLARLTTMQLLVARMSRLDEEGRLSGPQASLAKRTCTTGARWIASVARDLLGGNGILLPNRVAMHRDDIEAIHTYEGTDAVQALIVGRWITGRSAF